MDWTDTAQIIVLGAILLTLVWLAVIFRRRKATDRLPEIETSLQALRSELLENQMQGLVAMRGSLDSVGRLLNDRLAEGTAALDRRLGSFAEIENKLGQLAQQARNIEVVGNNIQSLSDLLKPPQLRGELGELLLENLLGQILPRSLFETQYRFANGQRVDAVVKLAGRLLPIDSKFPLQTFQRLHETPQAKNAHKEFVQVLRKHVDTIHAKYLKPGENTTEIALMYIPSEAVYYRFVSENVTDGLEYALSKRVIPSSPGHLYAFLSSLSAAYVQAGLAADSQRLAGGLNALSEALVNLTRQHDRIEGSLRSLSSSVSRAREVVVGMTGQLDKLHEPESDDARLSEVGPGTE
ncbi:MAG: DNA recombination protein RmuC [candidate division Zixibacteria bacterium]|nr:DNA recombination protein RmuC [candidate division Zixibacteria bacterium]